MIGDNLLHNDSADLWPTYFPSPASACSRFRPWAGFNNQSELRGLPTPMQLLMIFSHTKNMLAFHGCFLLLYRPGLLFIFYGFTSFLTIASHDLMLMLPLFNPRLK